MPDDELHRQLNDVEREIDTLQYGRPMYEIMARDAPPSLRSLSLQAAEQLDGADPPSWRKSDGSLPAGWRENGAG